MYVDSKNSGYQSISLPISFSNIYYYVNVAPCNANSTVRMYGGNIKNKTNNTFDFIAKLTDSAGSVEYTSSFTVFAIGY